MLTQEDLKLLEEKGITTDMLDRQIARFKSGFPYLKVKSAATVGDGIRRLTDTETEYYTELWNSRLAEGCKVVKFVPASGAASRMFKNLFEFVSSGRREPETDFEKKFFDGIKKFAFYDALNEACVKKHGKDIESLMSACRYVDVVKCLITSDGLDYGNQPKGLLLFHKCGNAIHTPVEEHLEDPSDFSILTKEAEEKLRQEEAEAKKEEVEFIGEEEEIDLLEDEITEGEDDDKNDAQ